MKFDLVFCLIDLDHTNSRWYRAATTMMLTSASRAFAQHDMRVVMLTDGQTGRPDGLDFVSELEEHVPRGTFAQQRGMLTADWALQSDRPMVFCDVDLLWNTDEVLECFQDRHVSTWASGEQRLDTQVAPDIVLTTRPNAIQPFNGGLFTSMPGQTQFWTQYRKCMKHLPEECQGWWGDQIAFAVMMGAPMPGDRGAMRYGSWVGYLPVDAIAPSVKTAPTKLLETSACHFKGSKGKPLMTAYMDLLFSSGAPMAVARG